MIEKSCTTSDPWLASSIRKWDAIEVDQPGSSNLLG